MKQRVLSPQAQCDGKHPFPSLRLARTALNAKYKGRVHLMAYRCPHCRNWHIGAAELQAVQPRRVERHPYREEIDFDERC